MLAVETLSARMIDRAHAVLAAADRDAQRPRPRALLAEAERDAATARPAQAERDVLKRPFVAALLVVDDQIAVLQADLVEVLAVETGQAQTVEPVEARQAVRSVLSGVAACDAPRVAGCECANGGGRDAVARECRRQPGLALDATPVASGFAVSPADTVTVPSGAIRIASSASTRLRLSARRRPISSAAPDSLTSAFGALATMAWS